MASAALAVRSISKRFGGQQALNNVDLVVEPGEIHGLLGENGSGKSTLIKILAGYHQPDSGHLEIGGSKVRLPLLPGQARQLGLEFVHQDLALIPSLSVVENLLVEEFATSSGGWFISWRDAKYKARSVFAGYNIDLDPTVQVSTLSPVQRALLAIVRAMEGMRTRASGARHGGILVLDEPTVFLPKNDIERLFNLVRGIAKEGSSIIFVSHDLDEVLEITDSVTVLRDGRVVGTVPTHATSQSELVQMIIGRRLEALTQSRNADPSRAVFVAVDRLSGAVLKDVTFELYKGEVLGVTGLVGSGFEELPGLLYGARQAEAGTLRIAGGIYPLTKMTPSVALNARVAMIPADRRHDGSIESLPVSDNITLPVLKSFMVRLLLRRQKMVQRARQLMDRFDVRPRNPHLAYGSLSGGNQQRALLAKWLQTEPEVLLLHEPTQGVDIGARGQIFSIIREAAQAGTTVLCASSDYEQLASICDRVLIFGRGKMVAELSGASVNKERITEQCYSSLDWVAS